MSQKKVTVRVPATTANIGPGFDSFGCALALYNTITVALEGENLVIDGCPEAYRGPDNLVAVAYRAAMQRMNLLCEAGLHISIDAQIPVSRGLGSSAALLVAGALAASALHGDALDRRTLLEVCNAIEGHPDNLAPALYGGMTASMLDAGKPYTVRYAVHPSLHFVAVIPDFELSTHKARSVLPESVPYKDAVYNVSHAAVLLRAVETGEVETITAALQDKLHQPYRKGLIAHYEQAEAAALELGALAYCISGAGPTQLALVNGNEEAFAFMLREKLLRVAPGWQVLPLAIDACGAQLVD
jgi:homoserine kinase